MTTPTVPQQMGQMPVGGADTGVAQAPQGDDSAALALGGGLVLAVIGGAFVVRRRMATN
ncbi:LPXTG cell wall anchor domain-containing protein [Arthrobacter sp. N1]|uniref:LPXTG cell wall anchor domain-containing protein n=1 Tax=Arthrobacter sp. N1 TaxID=619291 RepID=UPI003BB12092